VGIPEWQLTALVWVRALLYDEYGIGFGDLRWVQAGIEQAGRVEKIRVELPAGVCIEQSEPGATLSSMLERGELDAVIAPRAPSCYERRRPNVGLLFPDTVKAASEYFRRTKIFPIMHLLGIRRELAERHPWLPATMTNAFTEAKERAVTRLSDVGASNVTLPFLEERVVEAQQLLGPDFWSYGLEANRHVLDTFLRHHHAQGLSHRPLKPEELFHSATIETHKV
jgi:4,5-dihydroxyphthalate decarboxylase